MTKAQKNDIELCLFFCPERYKHTPTETEIQEFLDLSERGIGKQEGKFSKNPLILGKTYRGLNMGMWEEGVLEGTVPYITLLGGFENNKKWWEFWKSEHKPIPRVVVDFMKKEMFQGKDADLIERIYEEIQ